MKQLVIIVTAFLLMAGFTANAQMGHKHGNNQNQKQKKGMMQGGMMSQNMPMKKYGMIVNRLPNMQQQLSLSDEQVGTLLDLQTVFKKQQIDYRAELRKKQMKLKNLLADNASANQVKKQMEACSETKINMKVAAYKTAGEMKAVLNSDQKEQLENNMMQGGGMMNQDQDGMMQNRDGMMQNHNNR